MKIDHSEKLTDLIDLKTAKTHALIERMAVRRFLEEKSARYAASAKEIKNERSKSGKKPSDPGFDQALYYDECFLKIYASLLSDISEQLRNAEHWK